MAIAVPDSSWQDIIWREWRNTSDEEYAEHLFELVGDEPIDRVATIISILLGLFYGSLVGFLISLLSILSGLPAWSQIWLVSIGAGAILGGLTVYLLRLMEPQLAWRDLLARLTFNLSPNGSGLVVLVLTGALIFALIGWMLSWTAGLGHVMGVWALTILLAIGLATKLVGWLLGLGGEPNPRHLHQYRGFWVWWRHRPLGTELEAALWQACQESSASQTKWATVLRSLARQKTAPPAPDKVVRQLQSPNWVTRFTAAHVLAASGGEGVAVLQPIASRKASTLRKTAVRLLQGIEHETTARLAGRAPGLLCPDCLVRCGVHSVSIAEESCIRYYGCRSCRQSRDFLVGEAIAVLDGGERDDIVQLQDGLIRINWLARRQLFDFDLVEIVQACDEDVERFAIQVGNDTDPYRRPRYKNVLCLVNNACELSENTMRILRRMFGQVVSEYDLLPQANRAGQRPQSPPDEGFRYGPPAHPKRRAI